MHAASLIVLLQVRLGEPEFWYLQQSQHRPLAAGCRMSQLLQLARLSDYKEVQMENHVQAFVNCCGGCERIFKTPIPLAYTRCGHHHKDKYLLGRTALVKRKATLPLIHDTIPQLLFFKRHSTFCTLPTHTSKMQSWSNHLLKACLFAVLGQEPNRSMARTITQYLP